MKVWFKWVCGCVNIVLMHMQDDTGTACREWEEGHRGGTLGSGRRGIGEGP